MGKVRCGVAGKNRLRNAWLYQLRHPNAKPHFGELYKLKKFIMKGMNNGEAIALKLKDIEDIDIEKTNYEDYVKELEKFPFKNANEKELNELIETTKAAKTSIKRLKTQADWETIDMKTTNEKKRILTMEKKLQKSIK